MKQCPSNEQKSKATDKAIIDTECRLIPSANSRIANELSSMSLSILHKSSVVMGRDSFLGYKIIEI